MASQAKLAGGATLSGPGALVLAIAELLLTALRPTSIHRVEWMAPKLIVFLGAYVLARRSWLGEPGAAIPAVKRELGADAYGS